MATLPLVLLILAIVLALFGLVFVTLGVSSERAYWAQRDPSGDARADATTLASILVQAPRLAVGEARAPLRVSAIGVLMCYLAIACAILCLLLQIW